MNRKVFDGKPGPAMLLVAAGVLVVGGVIAWLVSKDGGSEPAFTAAGEAAAAPPFPDLTAPLADPGEGPRPTSDRPKDERADGTTSSTRSRERAEEARGRGRPAQAEGADRRDDAKLAPDLQRLIEDATDGRDHDEPRAPPPARIRTLLESIGDGDQGTSGGPPPALEDALEEIARGG